MGFSEYCKNFVQLSIRAFFSLFLKLLSRSGLQFGITFLASSKWQVASHVILISHFILRYEGKLYDNISSNFTFSRRIFLFSFFFSRIVFIDIQNFPLISKNSEIIWQLIHVIIACGKNNEVSFHNSILSKCFKSLRKYDKKNIILDTYVSKMYFNEKERDRG